MKKLLALTLAASMAFTVACTPSQIAQFDQYVTVAAQMVGIIAQILAAVGVKVPAQLTAKVTADAADLKTLGNDLANGADAATTQAKINAELAVLSQDSAAIFQLAQVSNPQSQAKINVLIGLATSAIELAESLFPSSATKLAAVQVKASSIVKAYNKTLEVQTSDAALNAACKGKSVHVHSKFVRVITLGRAA